MALHDGPADSAELLRRLSARYELEEEAADAISARLDELEQAGLVRRA